MFVGEEIPDRTIASALEFAVGIAAAGSKLRPPLSFPSGLKPFLKLQRLPGKALAEVRRVIEDDPDFRQTLASIAPPDLVDQAGMLWLGRPDGWTEQIGLLDEEPESLDLANELRRSERRREAAEQSAHRLLAENAALRVEIERRDQSLVEVAESLDAVRRERDALADSLRGRQAELRRAQDRLTNAADRAVQLEAQLDEAHLNRAEAERLRDDLLEARAAATAAPAALTEDVVLDGAAQLARELSERSIRARDLATELERLSERLGGLDPVTRSAPARDDAGRPAKVWRSSRRPVGLPGGVYGSSTAAAEFLVRRPAMVVLVDGYNVAKLGWPQPELDAQREQAIAAAEDVARRFGADITVVFDGASITGAASPVRRLVRVQFSPEGVLADDVVRQAVAATPSEVPVLVITNDQAVLADVRSMGANTLASEQWLTLAGRR